MFRSQGACQGRALCFILMAKKLGRKTPANTGLQPAVDKKKPLVGGLFGKRFAMLGGKGSGNT